MTSPARCTRLLHYRQCPHLTRLTWPDPWRRAVSGQTVGRRRPGQPQRARQQPEPVGERFFHGAVGRRSLRTVGALHPAGQPRVSRGGGTGDAVETQAQSGQLGKVTGMGGTDQVFQQFSRRCVVQL